MDDHPEQQHRILAETSPVTSAILSNLFLFGLIFGLSATIEVRNMRQQITNKFAIGTGLTVQFVCLPLLGFLAVKIFENGLTQAMALALLVVTSSPGGSYSNWWCSTFNADLPLSVAMTTVSSIASIAFLPFNLFLYSFLAFGGSDVLQHLDFPKLFISLAIVLTAIGSGLLAGYYYDTKIFHVWANRLGSICGIALIVFSIIFSSGGGGSSTNFWEYSASFYLAVAFPCLFGLLLANIIAKCAKLSGPEVVAIAIECCVQNTGIATSVRERMRHFHAL
jgi:predicted Na+-dependent transporter